jgi:hypothetical protein
MTQEEILAKVYKDITRLAGEIAIDRARARVFMQLLIEKTGTTETELNQYFQTELENNLQRYVEDLVVPLTEDLKEDDRPSCSLKQA